MAVEESPLAASAELALPALAAAPAQGARKWLAIGAGVGIEIAGEDLRVVVARVRPGGVEVVAHCVIAGFTARPATEPTGVNGGVADEANTKSAAASTDRQVRRSTATGAKPRRRPIPGCNRPGLSQRSSE